MEGLLDHGLRDILTRVGGIDRCVSEFIRITDQLLPARSFTRVVPELLAGSRTAAGVPVRPQLLGSDPVCLAENAARLAELRPAGIDLNFGCPAKTVNRHRGGAVLLQEPELIHAIVLAVRRAVPADVLVSAKMRLGYEDEARLLARHRKRRCWRTGGARAHQGAWLPAAGVLGIHCPRARSRAFAAGRQWRNMERARRPTLPRRDGLRQIDAGARHGAPSGPGVGHSRRAA